MTLNHGQVEREERRPVTLPRLAFLDRDLDVEQEAREAAARVAEARTIRAGAEAWQAVDRSQSFAGWIAIGRALAIGRNHALNASGSNSAIGRRYSAAFNAWAKQHHFGDMHKSTRSWALALHENLDAIEAWRQGLPERERARLRNAQSVVRRWQRATRSNGKHHVDPLAAAEIAWQRFRTAVEALPPEQALPLWKAIQAHAQAALRLASPSVFDPFDSTEWVR